MSVARRGLVDSLGRAFSSVISSQDIQDIHSTFNPPSLSLKRPPEHTKDYHLQPSNSP